MVFRALSDLHEIWLVNGFWWIKLSTKASWAFCDSACSHFFVCLYFFSYFWACIFSFKCLGVFSLVFSCLPRMLLFLSFSFVSSSFVCACVVWMMWGVGRTTSQQVEGCLLLQNSMAFWEWDKAPPPPIKPPKKSFSACCLVCGGLSLYDRFETFLTCP